MYNPEDPRGAIAQALPSMQIQEAMPASEPLSGPAWVPGNPVYDSLFNPPPMTFTSMPPMPPGWNQDPGSPGVALPAMPAVSPRGTGGGRNRLPNLGPNGPKVRPPTRGGGGRNSPGAIGQVVSTPRPMPSTLIRG